MTPITIEFSGLDNFSKLFLGLLFLVAEECPVAEVLSLRFTALPDQGSISFAWKRKQPTPYRTQ
jgi:hypothetical protein